MTDTEIDAVMEKTNAALMRCEFDKVNRWLEDLNLDELDGAGLICWLTITAAAIVPLFEKLILYAPNALVRETVNASCTGHI